MNAVSGKNYSNVVCGTLNSDRKTERQAEKTCPPIFNWSKSNRLIDATMSFYGLYVAINQQVTLQNQDPVLNETAELLGLSLRMTEDQITKDMLAATATQYDCTGGANGIA